MSSTGTRAVPPAPTARGASIEVDAAEFETAYRAHFRFVWRALRRLGVPERDLPDAVQEAFLVVHAKLAQFDGKNPLSTWIYAICLRVASGRRNRASERYEVLGVAAEQSADSVSAESAERSERRALLDRALDTLPLEQRAVFTLFELDGMSGEQIARLLEIPVPTVHSRLRLARAAFRRALDRARAREVFDLSRLGEETP